MCKNIFTISGRVLSRESPSERGGGAWPVQRASTRAQVCSYDASKDMAGTFKALNADRKQVFGHAALIDILSRKSDMVLNASPIMDCRTNG